MQILDNVSGICPRCSQTKLLEEFSQNPYSTNGYRSWCKACERANYKKRYKEQPKLKKLKLEKYQLDMSTTEGRAKLRAWWRKGWKIKVEKGYVEKGHYSSILRRNILEVGNSRDM